MLPKCPKQKLKASLKKKTHRTHIKPTKVDVLVDYNYQIISSEHGESALQQCGPKIKGRRGYKIQYIIYYTIYCTSLFCSDCVKPLWIKRVYFAVLYMFN